ncbi:MAG: hypothetical protein U0031_22840 [Thermomicrobiales bacterium]
MYHSPFDLEVHAKAKREDATREADLARQVHLAGQYSSVQGTPSHNRGPGAFIQMCLAAVGISRAAKTAEAPARGILGDFPPATKGSVVETSLPEGAAVSLAAMVVIARGGPKAGVRRERAVGER